MTKPDHFPHNLDDDTEQAEVENGRFFPPPLIPPLTSPEPPPKKKRGCWFVGLSSLIIVSLLAFALVSLLQFGRAGIAAWSPPWLTPTPSLAQAGRIAYIGAQGQLYTVQPNGENERQLTHERFPFQFPAWDHLGEQVAVIGGGSVVIVLDSDESVPYSLYESDVQAPFYLSWSPDDSQISFLSNSQRGIALRVVPANGSREAEIRGLGSPFYWDWLADSRQMLVHSGTAGENAQLAVLQADGTMDEIAPPGSFQAPGVSANGRYWAYAEYVGDDQSWLVISDTETGEQWQERHPAVIAMSWSPADDKLAYISGLGHNNSFWGPMRLFDTATGEVSLLSDNQVLAFFWSPDGRYIASFNTGDINRDFGVNVVNRARSEHDRQAKTAVQPNPHQFNLAIIDVASGAETQIMSFFPTGIFISQFLPFFDQYALSHNIWSPNSDAVVMPVREQGESRVKVVRINGSETIDLGRGDMPFWSR